MPRHPALQTYPTFSSHDSAAHDIDPLRTPPPEPEAEIDIAQFPAFTRGWDPDPKTNKYDPISRLQLDPFDPSFPTQEYNSYSSLPPLYSSPNISRSREIGAVPWSSELDGTPVDSEVKEERIRMLEREFAGKNGIGKGEEEEHIIGSVDSKGKLITEGPKKRLAVRCLQTLLALLAGGSSIYAALVRLFSSCYVDVTDCVYHQGYQTPFPTTTRFKTSGIRSLHLVGHHLPSDSLPFFHLPNLLRLSETEVCHFALHRGSEWYDGSTGVWSTWWEIKEKGEK